MAEYQRRPSAAPSRGRSADGRSGNRNTTGRSSSGSASGSRSGSRGSSSRGAQNQSSRSKSGSTRGTQSQSTRSKGGSTRGTQSQSSRSKGSSTRGTQRQSTGRTPEWRKSESYRDSGFSGFYKAMTVLAVAGLFAALYFGGHFKSFSFSEYIDGFLEDIDHIGSFVSETKAEDADEAGTDESSETTAFITTTAVPETTTAKVTTTTAPPREPGHDAEYVDEPDYESPYYIVVYTGSQSVLVLGKDSKGYYTVKTKCFTCSTGASGTPTRTGLYSILRNYRWRELLGDVYGQYCSSFSGSYLFHSILYEDKDCSTLYPNSYNNLGYAASHGCVRLCVRDAKWIYDNCPKGTQVHVVNAEGPEGESYLPELIDSSKYYGWDPTDPDEDNPYNR